MPDMPLLQQVALSSPLKAPLRSIGATAPVGVALVPDDPAIIKPQTSLALRDFTFPNNPGTGTSLSFHNGAIATGAPVQLIFWGSAWNQPSTSPSAGNIIKAVQGLLSGPFMSGLRQYGVRRSPFRGAIVVTSPGPPTLPNKFSDVGGDVETLVNSLINDGKFPEPDEDGGRNIYCVFMPPNTAFNGPAGVIGAHSSFNSGSVIDVDNAWYAWIGNGPLATMTRAFGHELVETCTDPEGDGWTIDGAPASLNEIGDICNSNSSLRILNGVTVEPYWSKFDGACIIPTSVSVRRTLASVGKRLDGKGLLSLQSPITSLNKFISSFL
jgi:hypothetical protein